MGNSPESTSRRSSAKRRRKWPGSTRASKEKPPIEDAKQGRVFGQRGLLLRMVKFLYRMTQDSYELTKSHPWNGRSLFFVVIMGKGGWKDDVEVHRTKRGEAMEVL